MHVVQNLTAAKGESVRTGQATPTSKWPICVSPKNKEHICVCKTHDTQTRQPNFPISPSAEMDATPLTGPSVFF